MIFFTFERLYRIARGDKVGAFALSFTVGGIEFFKCAAGDDNLGSALCAVLVIAVQHEFVSLGCVGILLLNGISTALNGQFTLIHIHGMDVADKGAIFNGEFCAALHIDCEAIIRLSLKFAVTGDGQITAVADGNQRPRSSSFIPDVRCVADSFSVHVKDNSFVHNDGLRDYDVIQ